MADGTEEGGFSSLFAEPNDYYKPEPAPTFTTFTRRESDCGPDEPQELKLRLIGQHSLWAHCLWNAGVCMAQYIDDQKALVKGKSVVELGGGAACPSLIAALNGAVQVTITDYPEPELIDNIKFNVDANLPQELRNNVAVLGHLWGRDVQPIRMATQPEGFDLVLMADLVFNHSQHAALLQSCVQLLANHSAAQVLVFFSHHRPQYAVKDMVFFELAQQPPFNFAVTHLFDKHVQPMFENDPGDLEVRSTVHAYSMQRRSGEATSGTPALS